MNIGFINSNELACTKLEVNKSDKKKYKRFFKSTSPLIEIKKCSNLNLYSEIFAQLADSQGLKKMNLASKEELLKKIQLANDEIQKHNNKVRKNNFLRVVNKVSNALGLKGVILKTIDTTSLDNEIEKDKNIQQLADKIKNAEKIRPIIELYKSQLDAFIKDLHMQPDLSNRLISYFKENPSVMAEKCLEVLNNVLKVWNACCDVIKQEEGFFKILLSIENNKDLIEEQKIGKTSRKDSQIRKIKIAEDKVVYNLSLKKFMLIKSPLSSGTFKKVFRIIDLSTYQIKVLTKQKIKDTHAQCMIENELQLMRLCKNTPYIVQIENDYVYASESKKVDIQCFEMPFYSLGELFKRVDDLSKRQKIKIMTEVIQGIMNLHDKGIIHRDIKLENIFLNKCMVNGKEEISAVVGDLGLGCLKDMSSQDHCCIGTYIYMSIDVANGGTADFQDDAWAIGIMLAELFQKKSIEWTGLETTCIMNNKKRQFSFRPEPASKNSIAYVIWALTRLEKEKRLPLQQAHQILVSQL